MARPKKIKINKKQLNIAAIEAGMWKYIRNDPFLRAKHHDELMYRNMEEERRKRLNRSPLKRFK